MPAAIATWWRSAARACEARGATRRGAEEKAKEAPAPREKRGEGRSSPSRSSMRSRRCRRRWRSCAAKRAKLQTLLDDPGALCARSGEIRQGEQAVRETGSRARRRRGGAGWSWRSSGKRSAGEEPRVRTRVGLVLSRTAQEGTLLSCSHCSGHAELANQRQLGTTGRLGLENR